MFLMSQNSFSVHKSFDSVLLTDVTLLAIVEKMFSSLAEIPAAFLFVDSFMAFRMDFEFRSEVARSWKKTYFGCKYLKGGM